MTAVSTRCRVACQLVASGRFWKRIDLSRYASAAAASMARQRSCRPCNTTYVDAKLDQFGTAATERAPSRTPATPATTAQLLRYERMLRAANSLLSAGGEDALQMKELARRSDVALATLYRYFPTKDHLLLAIASSRYQQAYDLVRRRPALGDTTGERVADLLLRQFQAEQREPRVTAATARVVHDTDRTHSEMLERISDIHLQMLRYVAQGDGPPVSAEIERTLVVVADSFRSATRSWLSGVRSSAEARFEIRVACRLLDLPEHLLRADIDAAARVHSGDLDA